jgi:hypothetical protein
MLKNDIKKNVIDNFLENGDKDLKKADVSYTKLANGQLQRNVKKPSQGWGQVDIKREGKIESYYLPEDKIDIVLSGTMLHDSIEDTDTSPSKLKEIFNEDFCKINRFSKIISLINKLLKVVF